MSMIMEWTRVAPAEGQRVRSLSESAFVEWLELQAGETFDVEKAWHGIHFVLSGSAWEPVGDLGGVVMGGEPFGEDLGYGPARWLAPDEVARLSTAMGALSLDDFTERIDFAALAAHDIYPAVWDRADEHELDIGFLVEGYSLIRDAFTAAAAGHYGYIITIS